jgi:hypothetical protein
LGSRATDGLSLFATVAAFYVCDELTIGALFPQPPQRWNLVSDRAPPLGDSIYL